ncbi:MAG: hypothetical protein NZT61_03090 [Deltaproteobacteria bacterium]|nr:hypothetical protein [Deltaproteobacteria bacterium]MCX7953325.1 hypothetical protein [Deltaproteobacteria bacterium]
MLLINLSTLKEEFSRFEGQISEEILRERFNSEYFLTNGPGLFFILARKNYDYFEIKGGIDFSIKQLCGRCLIYVEKKMKIPVSAIIKKRTSVSDEEDIGLYYADSDVYNIGELLIEQIVLNLHPFWLPDVEVINGIERCVECKKELCFQGQNKPHPENLVSETIKTKLKSIFGK